MFQFSATRFSRVVTKCLGHVTPRSKMIIPVQFHFITRSQGGGDHTVSVIHARLWKAREINAPFASISRLPSVA